MKIKIVAFSLCISFLALSACISPKKVAELEEKYEKCEGERKFMSAETQRLETENNEQSAEINALLNKISTMAEDSATLNRTINRLNERYDKLNEMNDELLKKQAQMASGSEAENQKLLRELQSAMDQLLTKEDELKILEAKLLAERQNLDKLSLELNDREKKVKELQDIIAEKDAAVNKLKKRVQDALLNFEGKGLTVEQKGGRIQVSMEAKLLFPSGSWNLNEEGKNALKDLAKALENQEGITILVEGHTDTDPYNGSGQIRDNWDLSVVRATTVVRYMLQESSLNPLMLTAAGRGEFNPADPGKDAAAKAKNRRIEIILTPNLDKLFNLLEEGAAN